MRYIKIIITVLLVIAIATGLLLAINFGLLKLIGEDLGDLIAGLLLAGMIAAVVAIAAFYLSRLCTRPRSDAPIISAIMVALIVIGMHMMMSVELRGLKREFLTVAKTAPSKVLWGAGEENPESHSAGNPITYGGKLDVVVAKRNAFLKKWGYVGLGDWNVGDSREVQFRMAYIFFPVVKL